MGERAGGRLCMLVHSRFPLDPRVAREAKAAQSAGYQVEVIALREPGERRQETHDGIEITRLNVSHRLWKTSGGLGTAAVEYLSFALLAFFAVTSRSVGRHRFDILQVHSPPDFLVFAGLVGKLCGRRVILDVHDRSPLMYAARFGSGRLGRIVTRALYLLEGAAGRFADHVITVHEPYREELSGHGLAAGSVTVVMNSPPEEVLRAALGSSRCGAAVRSEFTVAYHGTITPWYGLPLVVEALAVADESLRPWSALFLGEGDALDQTRALAERLGVRDHIEFSGKYLPIEEALLRVSAADCGVIPNLPSPLNRLTLSTKLLEYVALGVPAVVARLETIAEYFDDDEVTFFEAGDPDSLADALRWVKSHPCEAAEKGERARERYAAYSWPSNRARYIGALESMRPPVPHVGGGPQPSATPGLADRAEGE